MQRKINPLLQEKLDAFNKQIKEVKDDKSKKIHSGQGDDKEGERDDGVLPGESTSVSEDNGA